MRDDHGEGDLRRLGRRSMTMTTAASHSEKDQGALSASEPSFSKDEIQRLRRKITLMAAELHSLDERRMQQDELALQLRAARARLVASYNRRKELVAQIHKLKACEEGLRLQLREARTREEDGKKKLLAERAKFAAAQARRKEMAGVIARRDARLLELGAELQSATESLTSLQRRLLRLNPWWWLKRAIARLGHRSLQ